MPIVDPVKKAVAQRARLFMKICRAVSYTHLTLPTNREV